MTRRLMAGVADSGPVMILAAIAAAGSFTHIHDTAAGHGQHGWMAWAIAICIDLTCVMAARERQRDKRTGRRSSGLSWPTVVLVGGILLSLAANLAQAEPTAWGWVVAATPAAAFLVAVSMLERRAATHATRPEGTAVPSMHVPPSFGHPSPSPHVPASSPAVPSSSAAPEVQDGHRPELTAAHQAAQDDERTKTPATAGQTPVGSPTPSSAAPLVEFARRIAIEHQTKHGRPITRDALRARLGVSNQLASDLLRQIRTESTSDTAA